MGVALAGNSLDYQDDDYQCGAGPWVDGTGFVVWHVVRNSLDFLDIGVAWKVTGADRRGLEGGRLAEDVGTS